MKRFLFLLCSFMSFAHEMQPLLSQSLTYIPKSYESILGSQDQFKYLQKQSPKSVGLYLENMLKDIRAEKNKLYHDECGTSCKKCQAGFIFSIAATSPVSLYLGWLTHNFYCTLSGGIGTFIYLPAVGYYGYRILSEHQRIRLYENTALRWQDHLTNGDGIKTMIME